MYNEKTLERFRNPKFAGEIKKADAIGETGNVRCGDILRVYLKVEKDVIKDIKFKTYGCMAAIAASDMMCELALNKKLDDALKITAKDIAESLGKLPRIKFHCSILGREALKKAVEEYRKNN